MNRTHQVIMNEPTHPGPLPPLARLAGAFLLASALFGVAAIVVAGTYDIKNPIAWALGAGALICLLAWVVGRAQALKWEEARPRDAASRTRALLGLNAISTVLLVAVLLVGLNYIAYRRNRTFDLTKTGVNSLAPQTVQALEKLPRPVQFTYYYLADQLDPQARALLENYARSSDKVRIEYVNALANPVGLPPSFSGQPLLIAQLKSDKPVTGGARTNPAERQEILTLDEQNVTSALLKLTRPQARKLYFLTGHGEIEPSQLQLAGGALEAQNYSLEPLALRAASSSVPGDAGAVVALAPQADLAPEELQKLTKYLDGGGDIALFLAPPRAGAKLTRWNTLLKRFGVQTSEAIVLDPQQAYRSPELPVGLRGDATRHPIVRGTSADVVFPGALVLKITDPQVATPLFESSAGSQSVSLENPTQAGANGPFVLAAAAQKANTRALVVSSATLLTDEALSLFGNQSFVLSGLNWTAGADALVEIPPKTPAQNSLSMPAPTQRFAALLSLLVLPFVALLLGALTWWKRR